VRFWPRQLFIHRQPESEGACGGPSGGSIRPGDLLTTSDAPGFARGASDPARAHGAIIGKAMEELAEGSSLVLVLVNLQ